MIANGLLIGTGLGMAIGYLFDPNLGHSSSRPGYGPDAARKPQDA